MHIHRLLSQNFTASAENLPARDDKPLFPYANRALAQNLLAAVAAYATQPDIGTNCTLSVRGCAAVCRTDDSDGARRHELREHRGPRGTGNALADGSYDRGRRIEAHAEGAEPHPTRALTAFAHAAYSIGPFRFPDKAAYARSVTCSRSSWRDVAVTH